MCVLKRARWICPSVPNGYRYSLFTRPGRVQYKLSAGKPSIWTVIQKVLFLVWWILWGISNGWSLYGGSLVSGDYNSVSAGIGRDLMALGAIFWCDLHSWAKIPSDNKRYHGVPIALSYSKRFEQINNDDILQVIDSLNVNLCEYESIFRSPLSVVKKITKRALYHYV